MYVSKKLQDVKKNYRDFKHLYLIILIVQILLDHNLQAYSSLIYSKNNCMISPKKKKTKSKREEITWS